MIKPNRIIIVGGNAAGPAAAAKAKRVNPSAEVILFEASKFISTGTCEIPYVLSKDINSYKDIVFFTAESFKEQKGVQTYTSHLVEEIHPKEKFIVVKNIKDNTVKQYTYDKLVLATGSIPKSIPAVSPFFSNVFNLKSVSDLIDVQNYIETKKVKNVLIFGAGYIGLEIIGALKETGVEVSLIEKEMLPLPQSEVEIQNLLLELLKNNDVEFYRGIKKYKINAEGDKLKSIIIDSRILEFDLFITAVGFTPNNYLAVQAKLDVGTYGGIKVNKKLQTSDQHIFAAGDCIEIINAVTQRPYYLPFASVAHQFGHIAGENAAGGNAYAQPVIRNIAVKVFNKFHVSVGISSLEAGQSNIIYSSVSAVAPNLVTVMPGSEMVFGKLIYERESKKILGASFLGGKEVSGYGDIISLMIKSKLPADVLKTINYNYTPPLSPMINLLSVLGRKIK